MKLYAFQNATSLKVPVGVSDNGKQLRVTVNDSMACVKYDVMKEGSCALVVYNNCTDELYVLYDYQCLSSVLNVPAKNFAKVFNVNCIVQVDIVRDEPFVKVFMSNGQFILKDIDYQVALPMSKLNALDAQFGYSVTCDATKYSDSCVICECVLHNGNRTLPVFLNYGPYSELLKEGSNIFKFTYCENEDITVGSRLAKGTSRKFKVKNQDGGIRESFHNFRKRLQFAMSILLSKANTNEADT